MRRAYQLRTRKPRHNKVATAARRTTGWPKNKLPQEKRRRQPQRKRRLAPRKPSITTALAVLPTITETLAQIQPGPAKGVPAQRSRLQPEQAAILRSPLQRDEVEILPTGILYLPWVSVELRLQVALGAGGYRFMSVGEIGIEHSRTYDVVMQSWALEASFGVEWIELGRALGRARYYPNNPQIDRGDVVESAKSNAVKKIGKRLGIGLELKSPPWRRRYRDTYCLAVYVHVRKRHKTPDGEWHETTKREVHWRKHEEFGGEPFAGELGPASAVDARLIRDDTTIIIEPIAAPVSKAEANAAEAWKPRMHPPTDPDTPQVVEHIRFIKEGTANGRPWKLYEVTTTFENVAGIEGHAVEGHAVYGVFDEAMVTTLLQFHANRTPARMAWEPGKQEGTWRLTEVTPC